MPRKPIWTEGLFVSQHHFQQLDRYHEEVIDSRLDSLVHYDWGITDLEIDDAALGANLLKLTRFTAVWPDGTVVRCGEGLELPAPAPRSFEQAFAPDAQKLEIWLGLPEHADTGANLSADGEASHRRYVRATDTVVDVNTGTSPQEVDWARPNLRVFFSGERQDGFTTVRAAELVRKPTGQPIVRDNYVPPVARIGTAPFLMAGLQRVLTAATSRQRELSSDRKQRQAGAIDFVTSDSRRFWLLHTLNGVLPSLSHMVEARRAHPEEAYLLLAGLIGRLCTFSEDADPLGLPKFNFLELGDVFEPMFARVLSLLPGGIKDQYVEIPLEHRTDGMFIGKIEDPKLVGHEFFVAVKSNLAESLVRERVPGVLKMASWNQIYEVVKQARVGVRVEIEWKPPGVLPLKPGVCFFRARREGTFWETIVTTSTVSLYVPNDADWAGTTLALYAVDPANVR